MTLSLTLFYAPVGATTMHAVESGFFRYHFVTLGDPEIVDKSLINMAWPYN